jgi:hypothetical protein
MPMANPANEIEPYYSDAEVAAMLDPSGGRIRARSIRSERESGRLVGTKVAGKWLYRKSDVLAFLEVARCRDPISAQSSSLSAKPVGAEPYFTSHGRRAAGPSCTERVSMPPILTQTRPRKHSLQTGSEKGNGHAAKAPASPIGFGSLT